MNKFVKTVFFVLLCLSSVNGQVSFPKTNTWIKTNQPYFRLAVIEDGIHSISKDDLKSIGVPVETIGNDKFQIFEHGKEIPINVTSESIEFYGERTKADIDSLLYSIKEDHLVKYQTLYTDTAYYYLTYGSEKGKRFTPVTNTNTSGLEIFDSYKKTEYRAFYDRFVIGSDEGKSTILPKYGKGEGWGNSGTIQEEFDISNLIPGSDVRVKTTVIGLNDRYPPFVQNGVNQHYVIEYDNGGWQTLKDLYFKGRVAVPINEKLNSSSIGSSTLKLKLYPSNNYEDMNRALRTFVAINELELSFQSSFSINSSDKVIIPLDTIFTTDQKIGINNSNSKTLFIVDAENGFVYDYASSGSSSTIRLKAATNPSKLIVQTTNSFTGISPRRVQFRLIDYTTNPDFIILSSKRFEQAVEQYASYRESIAGGNKTVKIAYIEDIFNEFYFGYHHPLAIKLFLNDLIEKSVDIDNLLIIGKGISLGFLRKDGQFNYQNDIIPSIGNPCSDWYFGDELIENKATTTFGIGRISVTQDEEINNYLKKVKAYEKLDDEKWRKEVLHISGGKDEPEQKRFSNYMKLLGQAIDEEEMGANISYFGKESGLEIDAELKDKIIASIDKGIGLYSYFGHAALNVAEVDIGTPIEYNNVDAPLPMYFAGCVLGGCFEEGYSLGEDFIREPTGAVSWIASSNFSFETTVLDFTRAFYEKFGRTEYGNTLGELISSTIDTFYSDIDPFRQAQCWQTIIQGDPSIRIYSPEKPDYEIIKSDIYLSPTDVTAQSDSFTINVLVKNLGKAVNDSIDFSYKIIDPNGAAISDTLKVAPIFNSDTLSFTYFNSTNAFGTFNCQFEVDSRNVISEIRENNNQTTYDFSLVSNGSIGLFPLNYGIVNENQIELVGQSLSNSTTSNIFQFEIDTIPSFNSPWRKQSGDLTGKLIKGWTVNLLATDSQAYYWRIRLKLENNELSPWSTSSFSKIENSLSGWAQLNFDQISSSNFQEIYPDSLAESYEFFRVTAPGQFVIQNHGRNYPIDDYYVFDRLQGGDQKVIRKNNYAQAGRGNTKNGIIAMAFEPNMNEGNTFDVVNKDYGVFLTSEGEYWFDWMKSETEVDFEVLDNFITFLEEVPVGYHICMYSGYFHRLGDMPDRFYKAVESFGSSNIRKVGNNGVWIFIGTKGLDPGRAKIDNYTSRQDSLLQGTATFTVTKHQGTIKSKVIGPSKKWRLLSLATIGTNTTDALIDNSYNVIGITLSGEKTVLVEKFKKSKLDLSFIDPIEYPYLQLELNTFNKKAYKPATPLRWIVNYDYLPEGLINTQLALDFNADTLKQGQPITLEIGYQNVSNLSLKDVPVSYEIYNKNRELKYSQIDTIKPLGPGESVILKKEFISDDLLNENRLVVKTNPNFIVPELYSFNNNFERVFYIEGDINRPLMEVTVDGQRILNGDIVSPTPTISITGVDDNNYFPINSPSFFNITLQRPDSTSPTIINEFSEGFNFYPATIQDPKARIDYSPSELPDGFYTLNIQLNDASGNAAGTGAYKASFEVIGKSTITNFYPYPNPFSSKMNFVFTLTGDEVPDDIVIQILTVSGKVVREITKNELGNIKIGHNVSDFTWDGTDTYGNKLANGVYLYRVKTQIENKAIELRNTTADQAFKEGFGKIYILR